MGAPPVTAPPRDDRPLVLRRLAGAEGEREVAAARRHMLDTGNPGDHTAARIDDVEELRVGELVLAVDLTEVATEPARAGKAVDGAGRAVGQRHAGRRDGSRDMFAAVGGDAVVED